MPNLHNIITLPLELPCVQATSLSSTLTIVQYDKCTQYYCKCMRSTFVLR